jgi:hypothetical protein
VHRLAVRTRIDAAGQQLAGRVAPLPRVFQAHFGIDAERQALLLPVEAELEAPPLAPGRGNFNVKAGAIEQFDGLRGRFGIADRGISKGHERTT